MRNLAGPCPNCGKALGQHTRRSLKVCQMAAFYWLRDMAAIAGIMWFVGKIFINPKGLEDDLKKIGSTYTDAVRTLAGVESTTISEISRMEDKND